MKRKNNIIFVFALCFSLTAVSQENQAVDTTAKIEKARYLKGDIQKILTGTLKYPESGLQNNKQGDVIVSLRIDRNGKLDSIEIVSSPDLSLSTATMLAMNSVKGEWQPEMSDNVPVDKKYTAVFRYRIYTGSQLPDYKKQAEKSFAKQKFDKALDLYDKAIQFNRFDSELFESRSKVKELLGDTEGAKDDHSIALMLYKSIISVSDISEFGLANSDRNPIIIERVIRVEIKEVQVK